LSLCLISTGSDYINIKYMNPNVRGMVIKVSLLISILLIIIGTLLRINTTPGAEKFLLSATFVSLIFIALSIYEVSTSKKIDFSEKTMWIIGLLFLSTIVGIIYVLSRRDRIISTSDFIRDRHYYRRHR